MDNKQFTLENFKNIQQLIVFLHNKASAVIVVDGFALTIFIGFAKDLQFNFNIFSATPMSQVLSCMTFMCALLFVSLIIFQLHYVIFKIISPTLANHYKQEQLSLMYFEHIASMEKSDFHNQIKVLGSDELLEQLTGQVYEVAKILTSKTARLHKAIRLLFASLIVLAVFCFLSRLV